MRACPRRDAESAEKFFLIFAFLRVLCVSAVIALSGDDILAN
jgi:hypothetical protein